MWATLQDQSFFLGAALTIIFHAAKFSELDPANPITGRYLAFLPGAKVRDFAGPNEYRIALAAFLTVSLIAYYVCCQISPNILHGAARFLGAADAEKIGQDVPYPLYVAALFIGLTQPIVPVFSRFGDVQREFFHEQIEVPRRVIDLVERLTSAIEARAGADKRSLGKEVRNLAGGAVLSTVQTYGDVAFYRVQLERFDIADPAALEKAIKEGSVRELRGLIERLVFSTLIAVMRRSGTKPLFKVVESIGLPSAIPRFNNIGYFLGGMTASGLMFSICILTIAHLFALLAGPIAGIFNKPLDQSLWPNDLDNVAHELWTIVPPIYVCLVVAVSLLVPRAPADTRQSRPSPSTSPDVDLISFFRSGASVLGLCVVVSILIKLAQMFYEYGTFHLPKEALSSARLILPLIQSFIPVAVCLFTTWYLAFCVSGALRRGLSFTGMLLVIAGTVGFLAILYDLTFLHEYLRVRPQDGPGWEHLLFSVIANVSISICAFVSVVLFFKSRSILQKPSVAFRRGRVPLTNGNAPLSRNFSRPQSSLRGHHRRTGPRNGCDIRHAT